MRKLLRYTTKVIMSQNKLNRASLSSKLAQQNKVVKPKVIIVKQEPQLWVNKFIYLK